jgi:hypothetical protein
MSFAELLAEVKNLSPGGKDALRSFLAGDFLAAVSVPIHAVSLRVGVVSVTAAIFADDL